MTRSLWLALIAVVVLAGTGCSRGVGETRVSRATRPAALATATVTAAPAPTRTATSFAGAATAPTATAAPTPIASATPVPPTPTPVEKLVLPALVVAEVPTDLPAYNRDDWRVWEDADGDCQNTRAEVLLAETLAPVTFATSEHCTVDSGEWLDPYTGTHVLLASEVSIDHMVPLANAHRSGAWAWSIQKKQRFANDLTYDNQLIAVSVSANNSKSDKGPEDWRPTLVEDWCTYAIDWIMIKSTWGLTATAVEVAALQDMLGHCPSPGGLQTVMATPTPFVSPTPTPVVVRPGAVFVTEIMADPAAVPDTTGEWFELFNSLSIPVDINGWTIRDFGVDSQIIDNGGPLVIPPQGYLVLGRNADVATNGGVTVDYQYGSSFSLANSVDQITLENSVGTVIDSLVYGSAIVYSGRSASLNPNAMNAGANDDMTNWCAATSPLTAGDRGTPDGPNDPCQ